MPAWLSNSDWIFYTLAAILAPSGIWLLYRGLFKDRSKGKRRCPKCWYDMTGIPSVGDAADPKWICPECGRAIARERQLLRTRRYRLTAIAGFLLGLIAIAASKTPGVIAHGWINAIPVTVLACIADPDPVKWRGLFSIPRPDYQLLARLTGSPPPPPPPPRPLNEQLAAAMWERIQKGEASDWQSRLYLGRVLRAKQIDLDKAFSVPPRWLAGCPIPVNQTSPEFPHRALEDLANSFDGLQIEVKNAENRWELLCEFRSMDDYFTNGSRRAYQPIPPLPRLAAPELDGRFEFEWRLIIKRGSAGANPVVAVSRIARPNLRVTANAADVLTRVDTPEIGRRVQRALEPRLLRSSVGWSLAVNNRLRDGLWKRLECVGVFDYTIRSGTTVMAVGTVSSWSPPGWKDSQEIRIDWLEEPGNTGIDPLHIEIVGNPAATFREYAQAPFTYPATVWTGRFSCELPVVDRPSNEPGASRNADRIP